MDPLIINILAALAILALVLLLVVSKYSHALLN